MTTIEKRRAQTAEATRIRLERARERRIQEAADLLRSEGWDLASPAMKAAGWELIDHGPALIVDGEGDRWARSRDGSYYMILWDDAGSEPLTLDDIRTEYGIQEDPA
jgi:hypothetical protein